jgi:hypothetical protein
MELKPNNYCQLKYDFYLLILKFLNENYKIA